MPRVRRPIYPDEFERLDIYPDEFERPRTRANIAQHESRPLNPLLGVWRHPGPALAGPGWELTAGWGSVAGGVGVAGLWVGDRVWVVM